MSNNSDKYFQKYLGVKAGEALGILKKSIMFNQVIRLKENICYRCGEEIADIKDFSIEHKKPWIHSRNPKDRFYNLDNIAFSHRSCNIKAARHPKHHFKKSINHTI